MFRAFRSTGLVAMTLIAACNKPADAPAPAAAPFTIQTSSSSARPTLALPPQPSPGAGAPAAMPGQLPPPKGTPALHPDMFDVMQKAGQFHVWLSLVNDAAATDYLHFAGHATLLAPTDGAFRHLPRGALDALRKSPANLTTFLLQHVIPGADLSSVRLLALPTVTAMRGQPLPVEHRAGAATIRGARIVLPDLNATNGVVHGIDQVIGTL